MAFKAASQACLPGYAVVMRPCIVLAITPDNRFFCGFPGTWKVVAQQLP